MKVDAAAQTAFVALSGDANPLHTDPLTARRLPFGRVAVHGVHLALLALDAWGAAADGASPGRVRATFRQPVGIDDEFDMAVDGGTVRLTVDGRLVADVRIDPATAIPEPVLGTLGDPRGPVERSIEELAGRTGGLALAGDAAAMSARFRRVPVAITATLLAVTRLVGMDVPGLHSMLSSFDLVFDGDVRDLTYAVTDVDDRFSKAVVTIDGAGVRGTVVAFVRPAPADQIVDTGEVVPGEFAGVRALVVGGSRGLGAAAVQLLAAGGADVRFTYLHGTDDAARVAAAAPVSSAHRFDVTDSAGLDAITADGWHPTLLAWFASPPIFVGARGVYSEPLFERFRSVYVDAFLGAVGRLGPEHLDAVLWPSSEAVDGVPGMAEYGDAKRLGEAAADALGRQHPHLRVRAPRFPRLRTDQTASFVPVDDDEPAPHVLAALRALLGGQPG